MCQVNDWSAVMVCMMLLPFCIKEKVEVSLTVGYGGLKYNLLI